jgi:hypothetical protein
MKTLPRQELLRKLEEEWNEILKRKHEYPPKMFEEMEKTKKHLEFVLKYGHHGGRFFETTEEELRDLRKYRAGSASLEDLFKKVIITIKEISEQPY